MGKWFRAKFGTSESRPKVVKIKYLKLVTTNNDNLYENILGSNVNVSIRTSQLGSKIVKIS